MHSQSHMDTGVGVPWKKSGYPLFGILSLVSACRPSGEKRMRWRVLCDKRCDLKNTPKTKGATNGRALEKWGGASTSEKKIHALNGAWVFLVLCLWFYYNLFVDLYFDLVFQCFNPFFQKNIYISRPSSLGTRTVTLAFSFLEDVI